MVVVRQEQARKQSKKAFKPIQRKLLDTQRRNMPRWRLIRHQLPSEKDSILIRMVVLAGADKSSFIGGMTGCEIKSGRSSDTCTHFDAIRFCDRSRCDFDAVSLNAPVFDCSPELGVLGMILQWLGTTHGRSVRLMRLLYSHRITKNRAARLQSLIFNLYLRKLCRREALGHVMLGSTIWAHVNERKGGKQEEDSRSRCRKLRTGKHSGMLPYNELLGSMWSILQRFQTLRIADGPSESCGKSPMRLTNRYDSQGETFVRRNGNAL